MALPLHSNPDMHVRPLLGFGALSAGASLLGWAVTRKRVDSHWYNAELEKPSWQPPRETFGPVWTTLYALMSASAARVYRARPSRERSRALTLWGIQLGFNAAWSLLFFGAKRPKLALVDVGLLFAAIGLYMHQARHVDRRATAMMAPYLGWTAFAAALNTSIAKNND